MVQVPQARSGIWSVTVAGSGEVRARAPFMVSMRPRITAMEPAAGIPGSQVVLRGTNFPADRTLATVRLNGQDVPVVEYTREAITVTVPANAQTGRFEIIGRLQGTGRADADFAVLQPVTLTAVDLSAAPVGSTITLRGTGFEPDPTRLRIRIGAALVPALTSSTSEATFRAPLRLRDGALVVEADGRQPVQAPENFRVTVPPVVTGVTPAMRAAPGASITLRGRNFGAPTRRRWRSASGTAALRGDCGHPHGGHLPPCLRRCAAAGWYLRVRHAGESRGAHRRFMALARAPPAITFDRPTGVPSSVVDRAAQHRRATRRF